MKSTKKALLLSMMSMLLCVAMLIGTTYAWFTDSVTSGMNRIVAGNLDVDMLYKSGNMTEYQTVNGVANTEDGSTPFFVDKDGGKILWEPGVMVYTYFDVKNLGTLALRYNFALRITEKNALMTGGVKHSLDEVIKAVVLPGEVAGNQVKSSVEGQEWKSIETFTDADSLQPNGNKKFTVVLYWAPTANDDLYNVKNGQTTTNVGAWENHSANALYINFDIRLTATQLESENDSFDNTYDMFADLWKLSTVNPDGRWVGITKGESCILDGTLDPYITVVGADGQPGEIIALTNGLSMSVGSGTITVNGNNVTYTNSGAAQEVVIRTGSLETELTVNAPNDVVKHYYKAGAVKIIEAHTASYHEYGKVPFVEIAKGRIALEEGAEVEKLHFDATTAKDFEQIIVAAAPSVTLPEFSRDEAIIKENGTLVVELQKDTNNDSDTKSDYVWLYKQGVISQIVVANENIEGIEKDATTGDLKGAIKESSEYETLQLGVTTKAQETQKAAVEIANNYTGSHGTTQTVGGKEDVNVAELDQNGDIKDENPEEVVEKTGLTEEQKTEKKEDVVHEAIREEKLANIPAPVGKKIIGLTNDPTEAITNDGYKLVKQGDYYSFPDVQSGQNNYYLGTNLSMDAPIKVATGTEIVFDIYGCMINYTNGIKGTSHLICNNGTLTLKDSTDVNRDGTGIGLVTTMCLEPDHDWDPNNQPDDFPGYASNLIVNYGVLTIESGKYQNTSEANACYVVDNSTNSVNATLTINGGYLLQSNHDCCVRMHCNSTSKLNKMTVNGGILEGGRAIWIQLTGGTNSMPSELIINGGTLIGYDNYPLFTYSYGNSFEDTKIRINGGTIGTSSSDWFMTGASKNYKGECGSAQIDIYGGTFNCILYSYSNEITIYGGTFIDTSYAPSYVADGYYFSDNGDGTYSPAKVSTGINLTLQEVKANYWYYYGYKYDDGSFAYCSDGKGASLKYGWVGDTDTIETWESHGYYMIPMANSPNWYYICNVADGLTLQDNGNGTYTIIKIAD